MVESQKTGSLEGVLRQYVQNDEMPLVSYTGVVPQEHLEALYNLGYNCRILPFGLTERGLQEIDFSCQTIVVKKPTSSSSSK